MEFFVCVCPETGNVIVNGIDLGPNRDANGTLVTKMCNRGQQTISLQCAEGRTCNPPQITVVIKDTDPISPMEVAFQCV
jgi:hypothetical protein